MGSKIQLFKASDAAHEWHYKDFKFCICNFRKLWYRVDIPVMEVVVEPLQNWE